MRTDALGAIMLAVALTAGCQITSLFEANDLPRVDFDPADGTHAAPPGQGDLARPFAADRARLAKAVFKGLAPTLAGDVEFAIDLDRGPGEAPREIPAGGLVRTIRGHAPDGRPIVVDLRPEGNTCLAIVRAYPPVDRATADALLDKVEAGLKATAKK